MNKVAVEVVTPERKVYDNEAMIVVAKGLEGELGVQAGHAPLVTPLQIGLLRIKEPNGDVFLAVSGGFLEVRPDRVTILAETAERAEEIDVERAQTAKKEAEKMLQTTKAGDKKMNEYRQALKRAENRLNLVEKTKMTE